MTTLEKILQEIENGVYGTKGFEKVHMIMRGDEGYIPIHWCLDIIKKHLADSASGTTVGDSGWISCSERLPEKEYDTVLCVTDINHYFVGVYNREFGFRTGDIDVEGKVIAWRPLPAPYKPPVESSEGKRMREREEFFTEYKEQSDQTELNGFLKKRFMEVV